MEELLSKIDELEEKLGNMIERYQALVEGGNAPASEELEALQSEAEQLREENQATKAVLAKVRERVTALLERVDQVSAAGGQSPSLF